MRRLSAALDHAAPVIGGVASWLHCFGTDRLVRWLRDNADYEPEAIA